MIFDNSNLPNRYADSNVELVEDSIEDIAKQCVKDGDYSDLIEHLKKDLRYDAGEIINKILMIILDHDNPLATTYALCYAAALNCVDGMTITEAANKCGISKQALDWRIKKMREKLGLSHVVTRRQWKKSARSNLKLVRQQQRTNPQCYQFFGCN